MKNIKHLNANENSLLTTQTDIKNYYEILDIINRYPLQFQHTHEFKRFIFWINEKTPKLSDPFYVMSTKLYWLFNGFTDFPRCKQCNKPLIHKNIRLRSIHQSFCSSHCIANNLEIYAKKEKTCEQKYGEGIKNPSQASCVKEQKEQTCLKHFGVKNPNHVPEVRKKIENTNMKLRGVTCPFKSKEVQKKIAQTNLKNLGVENPFELSSVAYKGLQGRLKKYGSVRGKMQIYTYDNISFDSSWELAVWIYHKDKNIPIERQPIQLQYEMNGTMHTYLPDFKINEQLIEIKGDHLFDENGNPIFDHKHSWKEKYQCMLNNNVIIWKFKEIQPFLLYVFQTYGKDYLKQFRVYRQKKVDTIEP